jgi:hypothetical protein
MPLHGTRVDGRQRVGDLQYSLQLLTGLGRELRGLADGMEGAVAGTRWDSGEVGHRRVADALGEFAGSWDDQRSKLTTSLRAVGDMAVDSAETFQQVDDELAAKIEGIVEGGQ